MMMRTRRCLLGTAAAILTLGCLAGGDPTGEDCGTLEPAPIDDPADGITDLIVSNDRATTSTVKIAVDGPDGRRCSTVTLEPDEEVPYPEIFENRTDYTLTAYVAEPKELRQSHDWQPEHLDNRGVVVEMGTDISFDEYQH